VVARDLDEDPEQLSMECLSFLSYAHAKSIFDEAIKSGDQKTLDSYQDSDLMSRVRRNVLDTKVARVKHRKEHPEAGVARCRLCATIAREEREKEWAARRAARAKE